MKDFYQKNKLTLMLLAFLAVVLVAIRFIFLPYISSIREESDRMQEKIIDNEMSRERLSKISQMEEVYDRFNADKDALNVIVDPDLKVDLIKDLEEMAKETGNKYELNIIEDSASGALRNKKQEIAKEGEKGILEELAYEKRLPMMKITLEGDYSGLLNFINKLENFKYYINIISIDSKKEALSDDKFSSQSASGLFGNSRSEQESNDSVENENLAEKDFLESVISIVVYTK